MEFAEGFRFPVFDEFIRPTDALDGSVKTCGMKIFDDACAETIEQNVILEGAENPAFTGVFLQHGGIHRLDETWIDEGDG